MRSILEEFAYGNISPENKTLKHNSSYKKALDILYKTEQQLLWKISFTGTS